MLLNITNLTFLQSQSDTQPDGQAVPDLGASDFLQAVQPVKHADVPESPQI